MTPQEVKDCSNALIKKNWTIGFVESASAGKLCYEFSTVPESGKILIGGMVCYDAYMKEELLKIPHGLIETFTPESAEVTKAMAQNFCRFIESDVCVAVTGLTTAGGSEDEEKPVGTIFLHIVFPHKQVSKRYTFNGSPEEIVDQTISAAASLITTELNELEEKGRMHHSEV